MRIRLDEGVLHSLVCFCGIPQIVISDATGAALVSGDDFSEALAGFGVAAVGAERLHCGRRRAIHFAAGYTRRLRSCHVITPRRPERLPQSCRDGR